MVKRDRVNLRNVFLTIIIFATLILALAAIHSRAMLKSDVDLISDMVVVHTKEGALVPVEFESSALFWTKTYRIEPFEKGAFRFSHSGDTELCFFLLISGSFEDVEERLPTGRPDAEKILKHCEDNSEIALRSVLL